MYVSAPQLDSCNKIHPEAKRVTIEVFGDALTQLKKQVQDEIKWRRQELERLQQLHPYEPVWVGMDARKRA